MMRWMIAALCAASLGTVSAWADVVPASPPTARAPSADANPTPDRRADTTIQHNGVIQPAPGATQDSTVRPPNVDPGMTVPPPGTPGGNPEVQPK